MTDTGRLVRIQASPNVPRPDDPLIIDVSDMLFRICVNYEREGSGPGSRFEGRLLEDVQAEAVVRFFAGVLLGERPAVTAP